MYICVGVCVFECVCVGTLYIYILLYYIRPPLKNCLFPITPTLKKLFVSYHPHRKSKSHPGGR